MPNANSSIDTTSAAILKGATIQYTKYDLILSSDYDFTSKKSTHGTSFRCTNSLYCKRRVK